MKGTQNIHTGVLSCRNDLQTWLILILPKPIKLMVKFIKKFIVFLALTNVAWKNFHEHLLPDQDGSSNLFDNSVKFA